MFQKHFLCEVDECKKAGIAFATKLDLDIHTVRRYGRWDYGNYGYTYGKWGGTVDRSDYGRHDYGR